MSKLFEGLDALGIKVDDKIDIYEENKVSPEEQSEIVDNKEKIDEEEFLFDKEIECAVCFEKFTSRVVKTGKLKIIDSDSDLRPIYREFDMGKYDVWSCPHCGYTSLSRFFSGITSKQRSFIKEQSMESHGVENENATYSIDDAIMRYKLALYYSILKKGKLSEKAYTCLKLAWMFRSKREELEKSLEKLLDVENAKDINFEEVVKVKMEIGELRDREKEAIQNAVVGFDEAYDKENFPICGMDEATLGYLIAELYRKIGEYEKSLRWVNSLLMKQVGNKRLRERITILKNHVMEERNHS
ncbi:MAG: DUF2225 domain-containing protein [Eubacterium sp.]|nr:DUF2225 domain-containing protein [Eubacterium sp.]